MAVTVILRTIVIEEPFTWKRIKPRAAGESWVAVCDKLGITAEADKEENLERTAADAMDLLFKSLAKHGDAVEFLTRHKVPFRVEERPIGSGQTPEKHNDAFTISPRLIQIQQGPARVSAPV